MVFRISYIISKIILSFLFRFRLLSKIPILFIKKLLPKTTFEKRLLKSIKINQNLSTDIIPATIVHNLSGLKLNLYRMNSLIKPLKAIELIDNNSKILVIGPRNEWDLFLLGNEGFKNISGFDLISYSPYIETGDMHEISSFYEKDLFDVVLIGWTISYSSNPQKVANEILKITKNGGVIGIAVEYASDNLSEDDLWTLRDGYSLVDRSKLPQRINSVSQILNLFHEKVKYVFFQHDAPLKIHHKPNEPLKSNVSSVVVIFSINK